MNRSYWLRLANATCLIAVVGCAADQTDLPDQAALDIEMEVRSALSRLNAYSIEARWDSVATFYSDSPAFAFYENGELRYPTADAIRQALRALPSGFEIRTVYSETELHVLSRDFVALGTKFHTRFSDSSTVIFEYGGALTLNWVREGAKWRILSGHSSAPLPRGDYEDN